MREKTLENKIKKHLQKNGHYYIKISASVTMRSGLPDIISCIFGAFVSFEIKNPNGKGILSKLQKAHIKMIKDAKGHAFVISNWDEYLKIYERIINAV